jgi:hypothetical protein
MFSRKSTKTTTPATDVEGTELTKKTNTKDIILGGGAILVYSTVVAVVSHVIANVIVKAIISVLPSESE